MMRLRWTRTILCALGFIWVMVQWRAHERRAAAEQARVTALLANMCADRPDQKARDGCEMAFRLQGLGSGVRVSGSVDVNGSVDVQ